MKYLTTIIMLFILSGCGSDSDNSNDETATTEKVTTPQDSNNDNTEKFSWASEPGIPDDADLFAYGTDCEEFSHVDHLPWNDRPSACPVGDWCMKKDDGFIDGAKTWFGLPAVSQYATITCKIGNRCLRFVGMNNCHYDLFDPDTKLTLKPADNIPWARKDGHSYLNFRVRLPDSDVIYNFMSTTAEAQQDAKQAVYCPANVYAPDGLEPLLYDPRQSDQTTGCGADAQYIRQFGDLRDPIPYDTDQRDSYDWTYKQQGEQIK